MVTANLDFDDAQQWLFFMSRALEYKWNQPFTNYTYGGRTWSASSVFKLRNAAELEDMWRAMNAYDLPMSATKPVTDRQDWFSLRQDFFGFRDGRTYTDPVTRRQLDPVSAFRTNLLRRLVTTGSGQDCSVTFDTVRQIPGGSFFVGPIFSASQPPTVADPGRYLDKISFVKIRLVGTNLSSTAPLAGRLTYGGTSYVRTPHVGSFDATRPDRLVNEMTAYGTRYWYSSGYGWLFTDAQSVSDAPMERRFIRDPYTAPVTSEIPDFKDRSVAATGWDLVLPTISQGQRMLYVQELDDVLIYFSHRTAQRN